MLSGYLGGCGNFESRCSIVLLYSPFFRSFVSSRVYANAEARCWLPKARWCTTVAIPKAQCSAPAGSCSCDIHAPPCTFAHDVCNIYTYVYNCLHSRSLLKSLDLGQERFEISTFCSSLNYVWISVEVRKIMPPLYSSKSVSISYAALSYSIEVIFSYNEKNYQMKHIFSYGRI